MQTRRDVVAVACLLRDFGDVQHAGIRHAPLVTGEEKIGALKRGIRRQPRKVGDRLFRVAVDQFDRRSPVEIREHAPEGRLDLLDRRGLIGRRIRGRNAPGINDARRRRRFGQLRRWRSLGKERRHAEQTGETTGEVFHGVNSAATNGSTPAKSRRAERTAIPRRPPSHGRARRRRMESRSLCCRSGRGPFPDPWGRRARRA